MTAPEVLEAGELREGRFRIFRGVGRYNGDGWNDSTRKGEVIFTYGRQLPSPYAAGQYERVGNICHTATRKQYDLSPASIIEAVRLIPAIIRDRKDRRLFAFRWESQAARQSRGGEG
jgi:hypothetical protein